MTPRHAPGAPTRRALATAGHVLIGVPWGAAWTLVVVGGLAAGAVAFPVGLPIAAATLLLVPLGAELERDRAVRLLGHRPERPEPPPAGGAARRLRVHLRSRATWREVLHLVTFGPLALLELAVVGAWALATAAALAAGWWLPAGPIVVGPLTVSRPVLVTLLALNGAAALLAGRALVRGLGALQRSHVTRLLGSPEAVWRARVEEAERRQALLVRAARAERERIERDLHDGLQPVLVSTAVTIAGARRRLVSEPERAARDLEEAQAFLQTAMDDVRALVQGLAPRSLREAGLDAALGELAAGVPIPTALEVDLRELVDDEAAVAAYFVASEAVTNAVRHGSAERITIQVASGAGQLDVAVLDDGVGGAVPKAGRGLEGLDARVRAVGGALVVDSPRGAGTAVRASVPIGGGR
jgi:signal transduction histidine kinase